MSQTCFIRNAICVIRRILSTMTGTCPRGPSPARSVARGRFRHLRGLDKPAKVSSKIRACKESTAASGLSRTDAAEYLHAFKGVADREGISGGKAKQNLVKRVVFRSHFSVEKKIHRLLSLLYPEKTSQIHRSTIRASYHQNI